jgi:hypothetical protein
LEKLEMIMNPQQLSNDPFDTMPEVPFHELPIEHHNIAVHDGIGITIPSGSRVEVWRVKDSDGIQICMRRPLQSCRQSVLRFGLTRDAAEALFEMLHTQIYTTPNDELARTEGGKES